MKNSIQKVLQQLATHHGQKKSPFFLAEGLRCCREALERRPGWIAHVIVSGETLDHSTEMQRLAELAGNRLEIVTEREFSQAAVTENPQGILCIMEKPENSSLPAALPKTMCLILDQVREPGNVGTILRTAWAAGLDQVWLTDGSAGVFSPKVIRSGMGAQFAIDTFYFPTLTNAVAHFRSLGGTTVWCTMPLAGTNVYSPNFTPLGSAVILGNEANGITDPTVGTPVTIPMPGHAESLNVAQAATIFIFEAVRAVEKNRK